MIQFALFFALIIFGTSVIPGAAKAIPSGRGSATVKSEAVEIMRRAIYGSDSFAVVDDMKKALALDPNCPEAIAQRGVQKYLEHDFKGAIADCSKALELKPKVQFYERAALNFRYHAYIELKDYKKAMDSCLACLALRHDPPVALDAAKLSKILGRTEDAKKYSGLADQYSKEYQQELLAKRSLRKNAQDPQRVDETLAALNKKLKNDPNDMEARVIRALCYKEKRALLEKSASVMTNAEANQKKGLLKGELDDLTALIDAGCELTAALRQRAGVYKEMGQADLAKKDEKAADERAGSNARCCRD